MLHTFSTQSRLAYVALFYWLHVWGYVSNVFLAPLFQLMTFSLVAIYATGTESAQRYMVGMITYAILVIVLSGVLQSFAYDRQLGTLSFLYSTPVSRFAAYASRGALHFPNGVISALATIVLAAVFLDLDVSTLDWGTAVAAVALMSLACTALALLLGCWAAVTRDWFIPTSVAQGLLVVFTGILVPASSLPPFASEVGALLPLTHGAEALRQAFAGASITEVGDQLWREGAMTLGYGAAGYAAFVFLERHARHSGDLELGT